jgi:hypothetical protein
MSLVTMACPHCAATNANPGKFCTACGRALPSPTKVAPRVISGKSKDFAQSGAGQVMQAGELEKQAKSASQILIVLGSLCVFFGLVLLMLGSIRDSEVAGELDPTVLKITGTVVLVLSAIYFSLGFWAKKKPLPAAITGLVLYSSLAVLDLAAADAFSAPGLVIKVVIIAALAKAVAAGVKHRELLRRMGERPA